MPHLILVKESLPVAENLLHEVQRTGFLPRQINLLMGRRHRLGEQNSTGTYHSFVEVLVQVILRTEPPHELFHLPVVSLVTCWLRIRVHLAVATVTE